ncbi:maleylpyruvate isomerase N-terminal domain-containing protein [bacterium RCC_150]
MNGREWFTTATAGFQRVLAAMRESQLGDPGLGEWEIRSLLGHTCRAFTTIETYLAAALNNPPAPVLHGPADYFQAAAAGLADPAQVTQRGRDAGTALGEHPIDAAKDIVQRVADLVSGTADNAVAATPLGGILLADYLPTRAFEVTVHGIDLALATQQEVPMELLDAAAPAVALCAVIARPDQRLAALMALTGRQDLPPGFTVL